MKILKNLQVVLYGISENMAALVQIDKYGAINTVDTNTMGYYVIKSLSEPYTIQEETSCDGKISTASEIVVKYQYMKFIQDNTKWYW